MINHWIYAHGLFSQCLILEKWVLYTWVEGDEGRVNEMGWGNSWNILKISTFYGPSPLISSPLPPSSFVPNIPETLWWSIFYCKSYNSFYSSFLLFLLIQHYCQVSSHGVFGKPIAPPSPGPAKSPPLLFYALNFLFCAFGFYIFFNLSFIFYQCLLIFKSYNRKQW
jgi:hypothetical protein